MNLHSYRNCAERLLPEALKFLHEMVDINSFTSNVKGVNAVAALVERTFESLGFSAKRMVAPSGGDHLFLTTQSHPNQPTLALVSHLDTVFLPEEEQRNQFVWRCDGHRIYGPGTNDIKGGTSLIWLMLAAMRETMPEDFQKVNWVVALNACEEVDSENFGMVCMQLLPSETAACLIFEADGGEENRFSVVASRKGRATFTVKVEGRGAHAGAEHPRGANAILQLAQVVQKLAALTDYSADVTVNVGVISGGIVNNRVPHEATATLEMRAFDPEVYTRTKSAILSISGEGSVRSVDGYACQTLVHLEDETVPWPVNDQTERLIEFWRAAGRDLGLRVAHEARGGLSDGNVLWQRFPTVDGLGPRGENAHCSEQSADGSKEQEWVDVTSFVPKAMLNILAIEKLLQQSSHS